MKPILLMLLITLLAGCVAYQSNVRQAGIPEVSRVLVVSKLRHVPADYADGFRTIFPAGYQVCTLTLSPVDFERSADRIAREIEECQPDAVLTIDLQNSQVLASGEYANTVNDYVVQMRQPTDSLPFWKCLISRGVQKGLRNRDYLSPGLVLDRLYKDKVLQRAGRLAVAGTTP